MEIRSIKEDVENNYPTMEEIDNNKIKKNIPNKWKKIGVTASLVMINSNILSTLSMAYPPGTSGLAGDIVETPTQSYAINIPAIIQIIFALVPIIFFMISVCNILYTKLKNKKLKENKKVKKSIKILLIVSIILFLLELDNTIAIIAYLY